MPSFYDYFKENMEDLGLPAPASLFGTVQAAVGNVTVILGLIEKFGKKVTIREIIGAGSKMEGLAVVGGISAAFYAGAVVGSIAVATGRSLSGGTSLADVIFVANRYKLNRPWLIEVLHKRSEIYDKAVLARVNPRNQAVLS